MTNHEEEQVAAPEMRRRPYERPELASESFDTVALACVQGPGNPPFEEPCDPEGASAS